MSAAQSHPEELLDRKRRGTLTADEAARLDAHVRACAACAIEMQMRDDAAALGRPDDDAVVRRLAIAAIATARGGPAGGGAGRAGGGGGAGPAGALGGKGWTLAVVAAAGLGAIAWVALEATERAPDPPPSAGVAESTPAPEPLPREERATAASRPAFVEPSSPERASAPTGPTASPRRREPPSAVEAPRPPPAVAAAGAEAVPDAAGLFRDANAARREGDYPEAVRLYRELARLHPGAREEIVSRAILGRLLLDRFDDAAGALLLFDAYLAAAPSGGLAEDALAGRALALMRLGRRPEEREAWTELLTRHPDSVHADRARARMEAP